jgi:asparagine synthase (glutamine-hydrolysing)
MRHGGRALLQDTLSPETVRRRGLFRVETVSRLLRAHLGGRGDHSRKLFTLVVLELWLSARERTAASAPPLPDVAVAARA